jgi:hypothetical protein
MPSRLLSSAGSSYRKSLRRCSPTNLQQVSHDADESVTARALKLIQARGASKYGYRNSWVDPNYDNFEQRLGLAYQLNSKTVIRAAAGVYGRDENTPFYYRPGNNPPNFIFTTSM